MTAAVLEWLASIARAVGGVLYLVAEWPQRAGEFRNYVWCSPDHVPYILWRDGLLSDAFRLAAEAAQCGGF